MSKNISPLINIPNYLTQADLPWLQRLLNEYRALVGSTQVHVKQVTSDPTRFGAAPEKHRVAVKVLNSYFQKAGQAVALPNSELRELAFLAQAEMMQELNTASVSTSDENSATNFQGMQEVRKKVIEKVATALNAKNNRLNEFEIAEALFGDMNSQIKMGPAKQDLSMAELLPQINLAIAQSLLFFSDQLELYLVGYSRTIIKYAKLKGLICQVFDVSIENETFNTKIIISGPISLFHKTLIYGRAFASLLPLLPWSLQFRMNIRCLAKNKVTYYRLESNHPIAASNTASIASGKYFDSKIEAKFYKDFVARTANWSLVFEPAPFVWQDQGLVFPDFLLQHQRLLSKKWYLEIVAFYSVDYFKQKAERYLQAPIPNLILCVIESKHLDRNLFKNFKHVFYFKRKIDPMPIIDLIESV